MIKSGEKNYLFIEIMACPGGCINGGGQPYQLDAVRNFVDLKALRSAVLYTADDKNELRKSHESPVVKALYDEYLGAPGAEKAHHLLHTKYTARDKFN
jgi:iron only hydrogenase large subunit-like protein